MKYINGRFISLGQKESNEKKIEIEIEMKEKEKEK